MNLGETRVEEALEEDSIIVSSCIRDVLVPVADYVFDGDSEDERYDQGETDRWREIQDHV